MKRLLALVAASLPSVAACSFVLDFPEQVAGGGGSEGGGGAGGGTGGGPAQCAPAPPEVTELLEPTDSGASNYVTVTGLVRRDAPTGGWVDLYGESGAAMAGFNFPAFSSNLLFALRAPDEGITFPLGSVVACDLVPGYSLGGRVSLTSEDVLFVSGSIPAQAQTPYGFSPGEGDACASSPLQIASNDAGGASVPFFALYQDGEAVFPDPSYNAGGTTLGTAVGGGVTAGLGVGNGALFGTEAPGAEPLYFISRSPEDQVVQAEVAFLELASVDDVPAELEGGIAADVDGTMWVTGRGCAAAGPCASLGEVFVYAWEAAMTEPVAVEVAGDDLSFGTAARTGGGLAYIGGGYRGQLMIGGGSFEPSPDSGAFVAAIDPETRQATWTYPAPGVTPGFDTTGDEAVVDLAYVDSSGCGRGVVIVAGCIAADSASLRRCGAHRADQNGRYTFLVMLDAATGEELWATELLPNDTENDLLLPTALASDDSGFWLATSFRGRVEIPSPEAPTDSGGPATALVLYFRL